MIRPTKKSEIERRWYLLDAKGQILGRLATKVTNLLLGKEKSYFVRNLDCGDYVVIINAKEVALTGRKEKQKFYTSYSGYPGGFKKISVAQVRSTHPERIIKRAVLNMLPKNKLRPLWLKKLHIFAGAEHPYQDKLNKTKEKNAKNQ